LACSSGAACWRRSEVSGRLVAPEPISQEFAELHLLGETIRPLLERHFLTLSLLQRHGTGQLTRQALENHCHLLAQRLSLLYEFNTPEFPEKATFSAFIANLIEAEFLREDDNGLLHFDERLMTPLAHSELVLSVEARQAIRRIAGAGVAVNRIAPARLSRVRQHETQTRAPEPRRAACSSRSFSASTLFA
jgi:glycerol-3-phosphate O-acyltransferase